jgi:adenosylmethionine-8-amino-7-oxononanoate aminotransferase
MMQRDRVVSRLALRHIADEVMCDFGRADTSFAFEPHAWCRT